MSVDLSRYQRYIDVVVAGAPKELTEEQKDIFREAFGPILRAKAEARRAEREAASTPDRQADAA